MLGTAVTLLQLVLLSIGTSDNKQSVTLHKCCQTGEILNLHTKKCTEDSKERSESETLKVFPTFGKDEHVYRPIKYDFVLIDKCEAEKKVNLHLNVYGRNEDLKFFDPHGLQLIEPSEVCFDLALDLNTGAESVVAQQCLECEGPCVNFCCPDNFIKDNNICRRRRQEDNVTENYQIYLPTNFTRVTTKLHCNVTLKYETSSFQVHSHRQVVIHGVPRDTSEYCVDQFDDQILLCEKNDNHGDIHVTRIALMSLTIIALIFIIILHLMIEDLRENHITKLKIPLYFSLLVSFLLVVVSLLAGEALVATEACILIGFLLQFSALSVFFWLTAISVDVWMTFKAFKNPMNESSRVKECYLFSIVSPLIISGITISLQFSDSQDTDKYIHPRMGEVSCSLAPYLPQFLYFHLVIMVLLTVNLLMFCCFLFQLLCGAWQSCLTATAINNYRIAAELFFLMGINWITESASFLINWLDKQKWDHAVCTILDCINWSIGIIILVFFLCKFSNRKLVRNLLVSPSSSNENITKSLNSQASNWSADSKLSIRIKNRLKFKMFGKI